MTPNANFMLCYIIFDLQIYIDIIMNVIKIQLAKHYNKVAYSLIIYCALLFNFFFLIFFSDVNLLFEI